MLEQKEQERYSRQILLPGIGEKGQEILKNSSALVIGAGGLGSPVLLYLAAAGIGRIGIVENDTVSRSNLQRQILYNDSQIGKSKAACAAAQLRNTNPLCTVEPHDTRLDTENAAALFSHYDIVVDATDNLKTRYIIDEYTCRQSIPFVYGSVCEYSGQISLFNYKGGRRYTDLYPRTENIESYSQPMGIIGALTGTVGSIEAAETIRTLLGRPSLNNRLLLIDMKEMSFNTIDL